MADELRSESRENVNWDRRLRHLRLWRALLIVAVVLVGSNAAKISFARLGWSLPWSVEATPQQAEGLASASCAGDPVSSECPAQDRAKLIAELLDIEPAATDVGQPVAELAVETPTGESNILPAFQEMITQYRSSIAGELTDVGDDAMTVVAWCSSAADHLKQPQETAGPENVVLCNPADNGGTVHYLLDGQVCSLGPGEAQDLGTRGPWSIQFHRGGDFGDADRSIETGSFAFRVTESGWDLQRATPDDLP